MFEIQEIDPQFFRKQTRKATLIIIGLFLVIGMISATLTVHYLGPYNSNHLILNFIGAFIGLLITFFIVKTFFINSPWMREALYSWQLKRSLMHITNVLEQVKEDVHHNDHHAAKVLRFYHLGLEQMHRLEDNSHALIDLLVEKKAHEATMEAMGLDLNQTRFEPSDVERFKRNAN